MTDAFVPTGDRFFDLLLDPEYGGFRNSLDDPTKIMIRGRAGTGKSILSQQMAYSYVRKTAATCLYYCTEEPPDRVAALCRRPYNTDVLSAVAKDIREREVEAEFFRNCRDSGGVLFSGHIVNERQLTAPDHEERFSITLESLKNTTERLNEEVPAETFPNLVVIDSLNALCGVHIANPVKRARYVELVTCLITAKKCACVFVFEEYGSFIIEDHMADVVIELNVTDEWGLRQFKIVKARGQDIKPLNNDFNIKPAARQIVVSPHMRSHYEPALNRPLVPSPQGRWLFNSKGLDSLLRLPYEPPEKKGLWPTSSTLLLGHRGARKTYIALEFLAQRGVKDDATAGLGLYIGSEEYRPVGVSPFEDYLARIRVHSLSSTFMSTSEIVTDILREVDRILVEHTLRRLVFTDLKLWFTSFDDDSVLLAVTVLIQCMAVRGIACMFIETREGHEPSPIQSIVNNVITSRYYAGSLGVKNRLGIKVEKFQGGAGPDLLQELIFDESTYRFTIRPGYFEDTVETNPGEVALGGLMLNLYAENDHIGKMIGSRVHALRQTFGGSLSDEIDLRKYGPKDDIHDLLPASLVQPPLRAKAKSIAFTFDEYWLDALIEQGRIIPFPFSTTMEQPDAYMRQHGAFIRPLERDGKMYGHPYCPNCSVLVYNMTMLNSLVTEKRKLPIENAKLIDEVSKDRKYQLSWKEISLICNQMKLIRENKRLRAFMYQDLPQESIACLLLETAWDAFFPKVRNGDESSISFNLQGLAERLSKCNWELLMSLGQEDDCAPGDRKPGLPTQLEFDNTLFVRTWYTAFREGTRHSTNEFGLCAIPSLVDGGDPVTLLGDWHWGIAAGSGNAVHTRKVIEFLSGPEVERRLIGDGVCLPSRDIHTEDLMINDVVGYDRAVQLHRSAHSRRCVPGYYLLHGSMNRAFRKLMTRAKNYDYAVQVSCLALEYEIREILSCLTAETRNGDYC